MEDLKKIRDELKNILDKINMLCEKDNDGVEEDENHMSGRLISKRRHAMMRREMENMHE